MAESSRKIYTRFGDRGQTKLLSGETAAKDDLRVEAACVGELRVRLPVGYVFLQVVGVASVRPA